jgi:hypothetical protein
MNIYRKVNFVAQVCGGGQAWPQNSKGNSNLRLRENGRQQQFSSL